MSDHRLKARNHAYAKVVMDARPGYLRNLNAEGCKIGMVRALPYRVGEKVTFQIIPDETSGLDRIILDGELRWEKKDQGFFLYGFHIVRFASEADDAAYHKLVAQYGRS